MRPVLTSIVRKLYSKAIVDYFILAAQIALNTVIGFFFVRLLAHNYGVSGERDMIEIVLFIPLSLVSSIGISQIHPALIHFLSFHKRGFTGQASDELIKILSGFIPVMILAVVTVYIFSYHLVSLFGQNLTPDLLVEGARLLRLSCVTVAILPVSMLLTVVCFIRKVPLTMETVNTPGRLVLVVMWGFGLGMVKDPSLVVWAIVVSALIFFVSLVFTQRAWILAALKRFKWDASERVKGFWFRSASLAFVAFIGQVDIGVFRIFASAAGPGILSIYAYSLSLVGPLAILLGKPVYMIIARSGYFSFHGDHRANKLSFVLIIFIIGTGAIAFGLSIFAYDIIEVLIGGGALGSAEVAEVAARFKIMVWSIPANVAFWFILSRLFDAPGNHSASIVFLVGSACRMLLTLSGFWVIGEKALPWSFVVASWLQLLFGIYMLTRVRKAQ